MPIYVPTDGVGSAYYGADELAAIYYGADLVWEKAGAPVAPLATQWRVLFPAGSNTASGEVREIEMFASIGGSTDLCTGGTASSSVGTAANAFDGNTGNAVSGITLGSWIQYTFASSVAIEELKLYAAGTQAPIAVYLQYYDGANWITYIGNDGPLTGSDYTGSPAFKLFNTHYTEPTTGSTQWRIEFVDGASGATLVIREVDMRETPSGSDASYGGTATGSGGGTPSNAFDGDVSSGGNYWIPTTDTGSWLQYTFHRKRDIKEIAVWTTTSAPEQPRQMNFQYYNGSTWVTSWSATAAFGAGNTEVYTKP